MIELLAPQRRGETVTLDGFRGKPAVDIPPQAKAMGAFLQAEVATEEGDRTEALKALEQAVQYDPDNATLHVTLATLYVRDGRLAEARTQGPVDGTETVVVILRHGYFRRVALEHAHFS